MPYEPEPPAPEFPHAIDDQAIANACFGRVIDDAATAARTGDALLLRVANDDDRRALVTGLEARLGSFNAYLARAKVERHWDAMVTAARSSFKAAVERASVTGTATVLLPDLDLLSVVPRGHALDGFTRELILAMRTRPRGVAVVAVASEQDDDLPDLLQRCFARRVEAPRARPRQLPRLLSRAEAEALFGDVDRARAELVTLRCPPVAPSTFRRAVRDARSGRSPSLAHALRQLGVLPLAEPIDFGSVSGREGVLGQLNSRVVEPLARIVASEDPPPPGPPPLLLVGDPGSGRAHLARAAAGEAGVPLIEASFPALRSGIHGGTENNLRGLASRAVASAPAVLLLRGLEVIDVRNALDASFIPALADALAAARDGGVAVIATGPRAAALPPALRRLFTAVAVPPPTARERAALLEDGCRREGISMSPALRQRLVDRTDGLFDQNGGQCWQAANVLDLVTRARELGTLPSDPELSADALAGPQVDAITLADVGGLGAIEHDLSRYARALQTLRRGNAVERARARRQLVSGLAFEGPPGTGKTFTARALAASAGVPSFLVSATDLRRPYLGESERAVAELLAAARAQPSVVVLDEIDTFFPVRASMINVSDRAIANALLSGIDGLSGRGDVLFVGTTNCLPTLDPALLRAGRLERVVHMGFPGEDQRREILERRARAHGLALDPATRDALAARTGGVLDPQSGSRWSGATLDGLVRAVARRLDDDPGLPVQGAALAALEEIAPRRRAPSSLALRKRVAVHEAGHAVVAWLLGGPGIGVIEVDGAGFGSTEVSYPPVIDEHVMLVTIATLLAGRAAERAVLGNASSGAEDDLRRATDLGTRGVAWWGLDAELGPVHVDHPLLGGRAPPAQVASVDARVRALIRRAERLAAATLERARALHLELASRLDERGRVDFRAEVAELMSLTTARHPASIPDA